MLEHLVDGDALLGVDVQHGVEQVLELRAQLERRAEKLPETRIDGHAVGAAVLVEQIALAQARHEAEVVALGRQCLNRHKKEEHHRQRPHVKGRRVVEARAGLELRGLRGGRREGVSIVVDCVGGHSCLRVQATTVCPTW